MWVYEAVNEYGVRRYERTRIPFELFRGKDNVMNILDIRLVGKNFLYVK